MKQMKERNGKFGYNDKIGGMRIESSQIYVCTTRHLEMKRVIENG